MTQKDQRGIFTVFNADYRNLRPDKTSNPHNYITNDEPFNVSKILYFDLTIELLNKSTTKDAYISKLIKLGSS